MTEKMENLLSGSIVTNEKSIYKELLDDTVADAYKRLMAPSAEREMRNMLTERAEKKRSRSLQRTQKSC